ncbi:unnamed protein product, partial [Closterium sp. NIES-54]
SSPPQRPVTVVSGGAGGAVAEGEGTGPAGAGGVSFGGAGGVHAEVTLVEDTSVPTRRPHRCCTMTVTRCGDVIGRARYTSLVLCTDLHPCSKKLMSALTEVVALQTIASATKSTPDMWHARLVIPGRRAHRLVRAVSDGHQGWQPLLPPAQGPENSLCVGEAGCQEERLTVMDRLTKQSVMMPRSDRGGEFLRKVFTNFVNGKGIVHGLTFPYPPQQNGMAKREIRTVDEAVPTMLLHFG